MPRSMGPTDIDPETLRHAQCDLDFSCLGNQPGTFCNTEVFFDRDVRLLRCLDERECRHKRRYGRMSLCTCPVKHAQLG